LDCGACTYCTEAAKSSNQKVPAFPNCISVPYEPDCRIPDENTAWLARGKCMNCFYRGKPCSLSDRRRSPNSALVSEGEVFSRSPRQLRSTAPGGPRLRLSSVAPSELALQGLLPSPLLSRSQQNRFANLPFGLMSMAERQRHAQQLLAQSVEQAMRILAGTAVGSPSTSTSSSTRSSWGGLVPREGGSSSSGSPGYGLPPPPLSTEDSGEEEGSDLSDL